MIYSFIKRIEEVIPKSIKKVLKILGIERALNFFYSKVYSKYDVELMFQRNWVREFIHNKSKVLEYWEKYRYLNKIKKICNITQNSKILDVGCGICTVLHYVEGQRFGIDPLAEEYLKIYDYPEGINIVKSFGENIPFLSEEFDVIFCSNVLDHVTDYEATVNEINRVLKKDGNFILTIEIFKEKTKRDPAHPHSLTKNDIYSLLKDKFEIVFEKESPWIGIRNYVNGLRKGHNKELILALKKI